MNSCRISVILQDFFNLSSYSNQSSLKSTSENILLSNYRIKRVFTSPPLHSTSNPFCMIHFCGISPLHSNPSTFCSTLTFSSSLSLTTNVISSMISTLDCCLQNLHFINRLHPPREFGKGTNSSLDMMIADGVFVEQATHSNLINESQVQEWIVVRTNDGRRVFQS